MNVSPVITTASLSFFASRKIAFLLSPLPPFLDYLSGNGIHKTIAVAEGLESWAHTTAVFRVCPSQEGLGDLIHLDSLVQNILLRLHNASHVKSRIKKGMKLQQL